MNSQEVEHPRQPRQFVQHGKGANEETTAATTSTTITSTTVATTPATTTTTAQAAIPPTTSPSSSHHHQAQTSQPTSETTSQKSQSILESDHFESDHVIEAAEEFVSAEQQSQYEYEAQFLSQFQQRPGVDQASTSYSLYSNNPHRFSIDHIHTSTHYLTDKLEGRIWLDANGDGKRGDYNDATLNAMEYDMGIGGVAVQLINCKTDEPVFIKDNPTKVTSLPLGPYGGNPVVKRTEDNSAGMYSIPLDNIKAGRYYLMFTAPRDYRISGMSLPLERNFPYFDCIPRGGEGDDYIQEARQKGEAEITGYCARSIGCFEVDNKINPHEKSNFDDYSKLTVLENEALSDGMKQDYARYTGSLAALPSANYFNVGLAKEKWELPMYQYADAQITLTFPQGVNLDEAVPEDFERSTVRRSLEEGVSQFFAGRGRIEEEVFNVEGVDFHSGEIVPQDLREEHMKTSTPLKRRKMLRGSADLEAQEVLNQITYTLTVRGSYRPPPFQQLGSVIEDSINSDPLGLARSLKDKEELPEVLSEVKAVNAKWLTVLEPEEKVIPQAQAIIEIKDDSGFMDSGAFIAVISLAAFIVCLAVLLLWRRAFFVRRCRCSKTDNTDAGLDSTVYCDLEEATVVAAIIKKPPVEVKEMSVADMKQELESYGISTDALVEKRELVDELTQARKEKKTSITQKSVKFSFTTLFDTFSFSSSSVTSNPAVEIKKVEIGNVDRQKRMRKATRSCQALKTSELKGMLKSLGLSSSGYLDKNELIRALAEARVDGPNDLDAATTASIGDQDDNSIGFTTCNEERNSIRRRRPSKERNTKGSPRRRPQEQNTKGPPRRPRRRPQEAKSKSFTQPRVSTRRRSDEAKSKSFTQPRSQERNTKVSPRRRSQEKKSKSFTQPHSQERNTKGSPRRRSQEANSKSFSQPRSQRPLSQEANSKSFSQPHSQERNTKGSARSRSQDRNTNPKSYGFARSWSQERIPDGFSRSGERNANTSRSHSAEPNVNLSAGPLSEEQNANMRANSCYEKQNSKRSVRPSDEQKPKRSAHPHSAEPNTKEERNAIRFPLSDHEKQCTDSIDNLFNDTYSFSLSAATPPADPPEAERPLPKNHASIMADLKAVEPWMM